jgi:hypothetical protein
MTVDPKAVHDRMIELENTAGEDATMTGALATMLGVSETELLDALGPQIFRTELLCRTHYTPKVAVLPNKMHMQVAMMQGVTLAVAILEQNGRLR